MCAGGPGGSPRTFWDGAFHPIWQPQVPDMGQELVESSGTSLLTPQPRRKIQGCEKSSCFHILASGKRLYVYLETQTPEQKINTFLCVCDALLEPSAV